jgi:hypothetical protein
MVDPLVNLLGDLKLYDPWQVKLVKQIDRELEKLENSDICSLCRGEGFVFHKISEKQPVYGTKADPKAVLSGICPDCRGFGLFFRPETQERCIYPAGEALLELHDTVICSECGMDLNWFDYEDEETGEKFYSAKCHGKRYYLRPTAFHLTQQREDT